MSINKSAIAESSNESVQVEDYSLDPVLSKHCAKDIPKLCSGRPNHEVKLIKDYKRALTFFRH